MRVQTRTERIIEEISLLQPYQRLQMLREVRRYCPGCGRVLQADYCRYCATQWEIGRGWCVPTPRRPE